WTTTRMDYNADLVKRLPAGADVLELGCGAGVPATQILIEHGLNIALARIHIPRATLIQGDMLTLDFPRASFDAVLAFYSLFHLPKEEQAQMIAQIFEWLKPGGWLLCNFQFDEVDVTSEGWFYPEMKMFSRGLGVEGRRDIFCKHVPGFKLVVDKVHAEREGRFEAQFHWIMACREGASTE
ncbi:S-adenosyl-L-methionine-dependent methyltransferase, partial [Mycena galopus ATCC 62051]